MSHHLSTTARTLGAAMLVAAAMALPAPAAAQNLASRVANAPGGTVEFSFPARAGVCGNGRSFVTIDGTTHIGTFISTNDLNTREACEPGPVRVVVERADRTIVAIRTYVGAYDTTLTRAADLGAVSAREGAEYLLGLAATLDGRPGRDAIMPAALAEGVDAAPRLLAIARDASRPVETRRSALSWMAREASTADESRRAAGPLVELARDPAQPQAVRQQALSVLARLGHGAGIPHVVTLARGESDAWLARQAVTALARSGDPRARTGLREIVQRASLPDETLAAAVRGVGGQYATAEDAALLRASYRKMPGDRSKSAILTAAGTMGGSENLRWLLGVARDQNERATLRRSALAGARRAGAGSADLARLYDDGDNTMRGLVVSALAEQRDDPAVDKLLAIARSGDEAAIRRRAVSALGRMDDPRVKAALADIVVR